MTKSTVDTAYVLEAISGYDPKDSALANVNMSRYSNELTGSIRGLRIGINEFFHNVESGVEESVRKLIKSLEKGGVIIEEVKILSLDLFMLNTPKDYNYFRVKPYSS